MKEIMEKLKQANRILTGEEGPELTLNHPEDARYTYPERISAALKVLAEMEYLKSLNLTVRTLAKASEGA